MISFEELQKPFFVLAPMDDVTDTVFRQIVADLAPPDLYFTEFVNVDGLQSPGRPHLMHKLKLGDNEHPIVAQLWGLNPDNYYKTTKELIGMGYDGVDINMGCPVKTVVKNGACAALINNRDLAGQIIDAVQSGAGDHFPVSVKTRVGFNEVDLSWPEFLLNKKLNMLTIHGRTAKQMSKVPANWELIGDVKNHVHGVELAAKYELDGIMIGRGIFDDPFVFAQNSPWSNYNKQQKLALYSKHVELFMQTWQNNERRIETLNKFCKVYINGFEGAKEMRENLMHCKTAHALLNLLKAKP
jgi:tRNA-dihydrouridine synthase